MEAWISRITDGKGEAATTEAEARKVAESLGLQVAPGYGETPEMGIWAIIIPGSIRKIIERSGQWVGESDFGMVGIVEEV